MMLAEMTGPGWEVVAILCSIILGLLGSVTALSISRMNRQSKKIEIVCEQLQKARERLAKLEGNVDEVNKKYWENVPEMFERLRKLEMPRGPT